MTDSLPSYMPGWLIVRFTSMATPGERQRAVTGIDADFAEGFDAEAKRPFYYLRVPEGTEHDKLELLLRDPLVAQVSTRDT